MVEGTKRGSEKSWTDVFVNSIGVATSLVKNVKEKSRSTRVNEFQPKYTRFINIRNPKRRTRHYYMKSRRRLFLTEIAQSMF